MPKFKELFIQMLEAHDFELKKNNTEAIFTGTYVKLVVTPTESGYMAKASAVQSGTEASAESTIMTDAIVDCLTEFESVAAPDDREAVDELSDVAGEMEDDTTDYDDYDDYDDEYPEDDEDDDYDDEEDEDDEDDDL